MNEKLKVIVLYCIEPIISFGVKEVAKQNGINPKKAIVYIDMENGLIIIHDGNPSMNQQYFKSIYEEIENIELESISRLRLNINKDDINFDILVINIDNDER